MLIKSATSNLMFAFLKLPSIWGLFLDADSQKQKLELSEDLQQACEWGIRAHRLKASVRGGPEARHRQ